MAQVVRAELGLEAVGGQLPGRQHHDPGVVDEHVDTVVLARQGLRERPDRGEVREVQPEHAHVRVGCVRPDLSQCLLAATGVPARHDDSGAAGGERPAGGQAEPAVRAGDDDDPVREVHVGSLCRAARRRTGDRRVQGWS